MKVPRRHGAVFNFFRALSDAVFEPYPDDVKRIEEYTGRSYKDLPPSFTSSRVRRMVPPPDILYDRVNTVINSFKDCVDADTGEVFFDRKARKEAESLLKHIKKLGCLLRAA